MIKKLITYFLITCVLFTNFMPYVAYAEVNDEATSINKNVLKNGTIELDIKFVLPMKNVSDSNISVKLSDGSNEALLDLNGITSFAEKGFSLGSDEGYVTIRKADKYGENVTGSDKEPVWYYALTFYGLAKGIYSLTLDGTGYKTTTIDNINLNDYSKRVSITNENGGFTVGDVNNDDLVNETDLDLLALAIQNKSNETIYDLNRDGVVNTSDLSMLTKSIYQPGQTAVITDTAVLIDKDDLILDSESTLDPDSNVTINDFIAGLAPLSLVKNEENKAILALDLKKEATMSEIRIEVGKENVPTKFQVVLYDAEGNEFKMVDYEKDQSIPDIHYFTDKPTENTIVIDLKGQVAVKKVKIVITESASSSLADISKVEFLNNVYETVPDGTPKAPKNVVATASSEKAVVTFDSLPDVTGYEVTLTEKIDNISSVYAKYTTTKNRIEFEELENYKEYGVTVQGINGEWRGTPSAEIFFIPTPNRIPPSVDMVTITPASTGFNIGYKKMKDTISYNIYYREVGTSEYKVIKEYVGTSYQLRDLKEGTAYEVYITGNNEFGEGPKSQIVTSTTTLHQLPMLQKYKVINGFTKIGEVSPTIKKVTYKNNDSQSDEFDIVDNNYATYWQANTWDTGGFNKFYEGPTITFDKEYKINYLDIVPLDDTASLFYAKVYGYNGNEIITPSSTSISKRTNKDGAIYYRVTFDPITTQNLQINLANYAATGKNAIREIYFYEYDSLEDDVDNLFKDDLHVELKENVGEQEIATLEARANTLDEKSGEYHPYKDIVLQELAYARELLNDTAVMDAVEVDTNISTENDKNAGFAMTIGDLQPLGVTAKAGDSIVVYVGSSRNDRLPQLVFTQYHGEANAWMKTINLKKGRNVITVPNIVQTSDAGGQIYVRYPYGKDEKNPVNVKVRVSGGTKIPYLDIHNLNDENTKKEKIKTYLENLKSYVNTLDKTDITNNVLNATDIATKRGLLSLAADNVLNGITNKCENLDDQVNKVYNSLEAFDEMIDLFYRHKGFEENPQNPKDKIPSGRINVRYMRMFDGAFMYAGGYHIGIEYGSIPDLMNGQKATNNDGLIDTFGYFGWGISHEVGHQINQGSIAHAEVTNNVFALLAQTADDVDEARIEPLYETIYQKVTSGTKGKSSNVFVTLGMYWQLHLAYDDNKTFDDTNSIYSRMNKILRDHNIVYDTKDDLLIIAASKAANKNLINFFEHWGLTASETTKEHLKDLEEETRPIWYLNDNARRFRINNGTKLKNGELKAFIASNDNEKREVTLSLSVDNDEEKVLGYEIKRNGVVIGFTAKNTYVDELGTLNNRALEYEVTAYDKLLNPIGTVKLNEVKVSHDGSVSKTNFTISSNFKATNEKIDDEDPEMDYSKLAINNLLDGKDETIFDGTTRINKEQENPYLIVELNKKMDIVGLKYLKGGTNPIENYNIYVSSDNEHWTLAKTGTFTEELNHIYFDKEGTTGGNQLWTYEDIAYVKIEALNATAISGAELDILAPPGDNVELDENGIGKLTTPYKYLNDNGKEEEIPAGSVIFTGTYRGNPAFNVMILADASKNFDVDNDYTSGIYEGENFLFASLNSDNEVYEIAEGTWFYVLSQKEYEKLVENHAEVRAVLFRVNEALTNKGQRVTSTSYKIGNLPKYEDLQDLNIIDSTKEE